MKTLVFFLEEESARAMLESFLPRILPRDYLTQYIVFEGKSDLDKRLIMRLREWRKPDCIFIVLRDQDSAKCEDVKANLRSKCSDGHHPETLIRIACHEIESWYLGDLLAVEKALTITGLSRNQSKRRYHNPDAIVNPADELRKITKKRYQKVAGSRLIGNFLEEKRNKSRSFINFVRGIRSLCSE